MSARDVGHDDVDEAFGVYDFGLSAAEEERARRLHADSVIVDMLFEGPVGYRSFNEGMIAETKARWEAESHLERAWWDVYDIPVRWALAGEFPEFETCWRLSGITAGTRERDLVRHEDIVGGFSIAQAQFDRLGWLDKALGAEDIRTAKRNGRCAGVVNSQDTLGIGTDLGLLQACHDFGLRMLSLTYNFANLVGSGCMEPGNGGVTRFGTRFIARMNELGILVDTAHCGKQTTLDACELSSAPVIASHTSAEAVTHVTRAKSDEELLAIAGTEGVIGVCAVPPFVSLEPGATIDHMLDHVDYMVGLVGAEHVGLGSDWPNPMSEWGLRNVAAPCFANVGFGPEHRVDPCINLVGFGDYRDYPNITRGLVHRGYGDAEIRAILGGNFLRVFGAATGR
jgi:membrane dipeptidase